MRKGLTILLIDDSPVIIERLARELKALPFTDAVFCGKSYAEGMNLLQARSYDVSILDINLPDGTGIQLLRSIRERKFPAGQIIMMTEAPTEEKRRLCMDYGAGYFLSKFDDLDGIAELITSFSF